MSNNKIQQNAISTLFESGVGRFNSLKITVFFHFPKQKTSSIIWNSNIIWYRKAFQIGCNNFMNMDEFLWDIQYFIRNICLPDYPILLMHFLVKQVKLTKSHNYDFGEFQQNCCWKSRYSQLIFPLEFLKNSATFSFKVFLLKKQVQYRLRPLDLHYEKHFF